MKILKTNSRYSDVLESLLKKLKAKQVLREHSIDDWQGEVDVDVLLEDGRVFSYYYSYGSCSGCDGWEAEGLDDGQIEAEMAKDATYFDNIEQYNQYLNMKGNK